VWIIYISNLFKFLKIIKFLPLTSIYSSLHDAEYDVTRHQCYWRHLLIPYHHCSFCIPTNRRDMFIAVRQRWHKSRYRHNIFDQNLSSKLNESSLRIAILIVFAWATQCHFSQTRSHETVMKSNRALVHYRKWFVLVSRAWTLREYLTCHNSVLQCSVWLRSNSCLCMEQ